MDTKVFGYFLTVCNCKSFPRAAQELHITPQGLNSAMKRLEADMGVPLFDSSRAGIQLTGYGKLFLDHAAQLNDSLSSLRRGIDSLYAHVNNVIKLGCSVGVLGYLGEDTVEKFNEDAAAQVLVTDELPDLELEQRLLAGEYDFGLLVHPVNDELMAVPLVDDHQFFWVNRRHRLASHDEITLADLEGQTVASVSDTFRNPGRFVRLCDEVGAHVEFRFTGEMMRVYELARTGAALGLTCRNHIEATAESQKTVGIPFKALPWGFSVCYRRDRVLSEADRMFLDYLRGKRKVFL